MIDLIQMFQHFMSLIANNMGDNSGQFIRQGKVII